MRILYIPGFKEKENDTNYVFLEKQLALHNHKILFIEYINTNAIFDLLTYNATLRNLTYRLNSEIQKGDIVLSHSLGYHMFSSVYSDLIEKNLVHTIFDPSVPLSKIMEHEHSDPNLISKIMDIEKLVIQNKPHKIIGCTYGAIINARTLADSFNMDFCEIPIGHNISSLQDAKILADVILY